MANKLVAVFLMSIVVVAALHVCEAKTDKYGTCFETCESECKKEGSGSTACEMKCDAECTAKEALDKLDLHIKN